MNEKSKITLPKGIGNAYAFSVFNTMSFNMIMGTPILLYFKALNASATVLSIVAAMMYILNIFQIPAANYVERVGYKKFVLSGWSLRTAFTVLMAMIAILPSGVSNSVRISLMIVLLFLYNTSRGISVCGFLPWTTQMVHESVRGHYISRDQMSVSITGVFIMAATAWYLEYFNKPWEFSFIFLFGFIAGLISLRFLKRMPDVSVSTEMLRSQQPVPWVAIIRYEPFKRLMIYNFIISSVITVSGVFYVPFLKDNYHSSDSLILMFGVISGIVGIISLFYFGREIDRVGNHPFLAIGNFLLLIHFLGWAFVAAKIVHLTWGMIFYLQITAGFGNSFFNMANTRMAMSIVPPMGRSHFFALFSVINNVTMGVAPIVWGIVLDFIGGWNHQVHGLWNLNAYTILFGTLAVIMIGAFITLKDLKYAPSMTTEAFMRELLIKSPVRIISRLWKRRPIDVPEP